MARVDAWWPRRIRAAISTDVQRCATASVRGTDHRRSWRYDQPLTAD